MIDGLDAPLRFVPALASSSLLLGSEAADDVAAAAHDPISGALFVVGNTRGSLSAGVPNRGEWDIFVVRVSALGERAVQWRSGFGTSRVDLATSASVMERHPSRSGRRWSIFRT
jgi:hypothetical protein